MKIYHHKVITDYSSPESDHLPQKINIFPSIDNSQFFYMLFIDCRESHLRIFCLYVGHNDDEDGEDDNDDADDNLKDDETWKRGKKGGEPGDCWRDPGGRAGQGADHCLVPGNETMIDADCLRSNLSTARATNM